MEEPIPASEEKKDWMEELIDFYSKSYQMDDARLQATIAVLTKLNNMKTEMEKFCEMVEVTENLALYPFYAKFVELLEVEDKLEEKVVLDLPTKNDLIL